MKASCDILLSFCLLRFSQPSRSMTLAANNRLGGGQISDATRCRSRRSYRADRPKMEFPHSVAHGSKP